MMSVEQLISKTDLSVEQDEMEFLQTGIETLVEKIYKLIHLHAGKEIAKQKDKLKEVTGLDLAEVPSIEKVLKVGSFYEHTKIIYPDEFDFILIFGTFKLPEEEIAIHTFGHGSLSILGEIKEILSQKDLTKCLKYVKQGMDSEIIFEKCVSITGPAVKSRFTYLRHGCNHKEICVDLVPAFKIIDEYIGKKIGKMCSLPEFGKAVVDNGTFLITRLYISFTESEVEFMKRMSLGHSQVYKILKYITNGNNDGDKLKLFFNSNHLDDVHISTYKIKTCMIYHMCACVNGEGQVVKCLRAVFSDISHFWHSRRWPNLVAGLHAMFQFDGNYSRWHRGRAYREKGGEILADILKRLTLLEEGNCSVRDHIIEPWSVSVLREGDVRCVMKETLDTIERNEYIQILNGKCKM